MTRRTIPKTILFSISLYMLLTPVYSAEWNHFASKQLAVSFDYDPKWKLHSLNDSMGPNVLFNFMPAPEATEKASFGVSRMRLQAPLQDVLNATARKNAKREISTFAGKSATLIHDDLSERSSHRDESYYVNVGGDLWVIRFTGPKAQWDNLQPAFQHVKQSFQFNSK